MGPIKLINYRKFLKSSQNYTIEIHQRKFVLSFAQYLKKINLPQPDPITPNQKKAFKEIKNEIMK